MPRTTRSKEWLDGWAQARRDAARLVAELSCGPETTLPAVEQAIRNMKIGADAPKEKRNGR